MTSGRKSPGAPSRIRTPTITATVPTTRRPVRISFRCNCILASFQNGAFCASAQELSDHGIVRLLELLRRAVFNYFSFIKHSHSRADAKSAVHLMAHDDRSSLGFFRQTDNQFVDHRSDDWVETGHRFVEKDQLRFHDRSEEHTSELQSLRHLVCRLL